MDELLANPAIQGGVAPFLVALVIAGLFLRLNILAGLAIAAGFVTTVMLTTGIAFEPMTSTRKITLLVMVIPVLAIVLQLIDKYNDFTIKVFYTFAAAAVLWVLWPVIKNNPSIEMLFLTLSYIAYAGWMMKMFMRMSEEPAIVASTAATGVGIAIGGAALIGASALLGQLGLALAAAGGAFLLIQLLTKNAEDSGLTLTMTSAMIAALVLPAAIEYAQVPWIVLPIVAIIPLLAFYPFENENRVWRNSIVLLVGMGVLAGLAFYLTTQSAGELLF